MAKLQLRIGDQEIELDSDLNDFSWVDEQGWLWIFDVDKGYALVREDPERYLCHLSSQGFGTPAEFRARYRGLDVEYAMQTDAWEPALALILNEKGLLIDGNHRVYKALVIGQQWVLVYLIKESADVEALLVGKYPPEVAAVILRLEHGGAFLPKEEKR